MALLKRRESVVRARRQRSAERERERERDAEMQRPTQPPKAAMHKKYILLHVGLVLLTCISGRQMTSSKCRYCADAFSVRANAPTVAPVAPVAVGYRSIYVQLSAQGNDQSASNNAGTNKKRSAWSAKNAKPYVPDGLTDDEYAAIKKREAEQTRNKDFGAFGPRWSRSTRPDGDWMLMRSLWTRGFDSNAPAIDGGDGRNIDGNSSPVGQLLSRLLRLRQNAPIFFVSYAIVVAAITCVRLATQSELIKGAGAGASLVLGLRIAANTASFRTQSIIQRVLLPCASVLLIRPTNGLIEYLNRKLLWSKRRSLGVIAASTLSIVCVCAGALAVIVSLLNVGV